MRPFEYVQAGTIEEAVALCSADPGGSMLLAGGTDLLTEIKEGVARPRRLIGLEGIAELHGIRETDDGLTLGAMATIAEIASHPVIRSKYTTLSEAAAGLATPQIRNLGTLGGNLTQRPRCWYFRNPQTVCLKKGGDRCYALTGETPYLCVTGGDGCYIAHPSDTAVALVALDALIEIAGKSGLRILPIDRFFAGPGRDVMRENILGPGELVTRVYLQTPLDSSTPQRGSSLYLKARERGGGDFAMASVAAVLSWEGASVRHISVVLGGVAPVPYRAQRVEEYLRGRRAAEVDPVHAASLTLPGATPLAHNGHKVVLACNLVKQAIRRLLVSGPRAG